MTYSVDYLDILLYNSDIMKEYKILDFSGIDFPFWINKGVHQKAFIPHTHNFIELEIITNGEADHIVDGKTYKISKGDVLVILPSFVHELQNVHELEHYNFKFDLEKLILLEKDIEKLAGFQSLFILQPIQKYHHDYSSHMTLNEEKLNSVKMLCELIYLEWKTRKDGYKWVILSYFLTLITFLSRNFTTSVPNNSPKMQEIVNTTTFIHENLTEKITLSMLSSMACLSERQYTRIFKDVYRVAPIEYVINCRLNLACRIIKNTQKPISEICITCGFGDKISFSRLFKKRYGITPGEYRKKFK
jgi:AraC-type DNA-binding domain-containing proteins